MDSKPQHVAIITMETGSFPRRLFTACCLFAVLACIFAVEARTHRRSNPIPEFPGDTELAGLQKLFQEGRERSKETSRLFEEGQSNAASGNWSTAIDLLQQTLRLDPRHAAAKDLLINVLTEQVHRLLDSDLEVAAHLHQQASELDSNHPAVRSVGLEIAEARHQAYVGECLTEARGLVALGNTGAAFERIREGRIGAVARAELLPRSDIKPGDSVIGLTSSGVHSNGFSLVRRIVAASGLAWDAPAPFEPSRHFGEALLTPTRLYVRSCLAAIRGSKRSRRWRTSPAAVSSTTFRACCRAGFAVSLDLDRVPVLPVFKWLAVAGDISPTEMMRTFNCGIGMIAVLGADAADAASESSRATARRVVRLGEVAAAAGDSRQLSRTPRPGR